MSNLKIELRLREDVGVLECELINFSGRPLRVRRLDPDRDLWIVGENGDEAKYYLRSSFGRELEVITLDHGCRFEEIFHLKRDYLFPVAGTYRVEVHYDTGRNVAMGKQVIPEIDRIVAYSNSVSISIRPEETSVPAHCPINLDAFIRFNQLRRRKRWWQFWKG